MGMGSGNEAIRATASGCGRINVASPTHEHVSIYCTMITSGAFCRTIWRGLALGQGRLSFVDIKRWYSPSEPVKLFSELRGLHPLILEKLTQQKLLELTDIQGKVPVFL